MNNLASYTIEQIADDTALNDHTGALIRLARALDEQFLVDQLFILDGRQHTAGHLTDELAQERRTYASWLMGKAQEVFDNYDQINSAF